MKKISQQIIKDNNLKAIYNLIFEHDGISRAQLASKRKLSKTTISTLVDELISQGFIYDSGTKESAQIGRKPNGLHLKKHTNYAICITWKAEYVKAGLIDISGENAMEIKKENPENKNQYVKLSQECYEELLGKMEASWNLLFVCVIVPGMVDQRDRTFYTTKLPIKEEEQKEILDQLDYCFGSYPVAVLNDTACYAYAEKVYGKVKQQDFAVFNFADGIGATFFIGNNMIGKAGGAYTQVGQLLVRNANDKLSFLEEEIGEGALKERLEEHHGESAVGNQDKLTYADLSRAARSGDLSAAGFLHSLADKFSYALSAMVTIVGVKLVILGGKSRDLGEEFLSDVSRNLKECGFSRMLENVEVRYSTLNSEVYLLGAVKYYMDEYFKFNEEKVRHFYLG